VNNVLRAVPEIDFAFDQRDVSKHTNRIVRELKLLDGALTRNNRLDNFGLSAPDLRSVCRLDCLPGAFREPENCAESWPVLRPSTAENTSVFASPTRAAESDGGTSAYTSADICPEAIQTEITPTTIMKEIRRVVNTTGHVDDFSWCMLGPHHLKPLSSRTLLTIRPCMRLVKGRHREQISSCGSSR